jgi:hypothetical protein
MTMQKRLLSRASRAKLSSGRPNPEKPGGIIAPLRITEIRNPAGEGVGSYRNPSGGISQAFDHHRAIREPGYIETEPVGLQAEAIAKV